MLKIDVLTSNLVLITALAIVSPANKLMAERKKNNFIKKLGLVEVSLDHEFSSSIEDGVYSDSNIESRADTGFGV